MSTTTQNIGLTKPSKDENVDIDVLNENFDKIDENIIGNGVTVCHGTPTDPNIKAWVDLDEDPIAVTDSIVRVNNTVASVYGTYVSVCSAVAKAGHNYLALGNIYHDRTTAITMNLSITGVSPAYTSSCPRGTVLCAYSLITAGEEDKTVSLTSYGYTNDTYNFTGELVLLQLD